MDRGGRSAQTLTHETRSIDVIPVATVISDEMRAAVVEARGGAGAQAGPQDRPNQPITGRLVETAGPNGPMYSAHTAVEASRRRSKQDPRDQCVNRRPVAIFFSAAKLASASLTIGSITLSSLMYQEVIFPGLDAACIVPS